MIGANQSAPFGRPMLSPLYAESIQPHADEAKENSQRIVAEALTERMTGAMGQWFQVQGSTLKRQMTN